METAQTDEELKTQNPPLGDVKKAEEYISKLLKLVSSNKLKVVKTDLKKFDPTTMQTHYRLDLGDYQIEISHSKDPDSGKDSYVMVFTNISKISDENLNQKVILAYLHLTQEQFLNFKDEAESQIERMMKEEEDKRFSEAVSPIEQKLEDLGQDPERMPIDKIPKHDLKEYDIEPRFSLN